MVFQPSLRGHTGRAFHRSRRRGGTGRGRGRYTCGRRGAATQRARLGAEGLDVELALAGVVAACCAAARQGGLAARLAAPGDGPAAMVFDSSLRGHTGRAFHKPAKPA